MINPFLSQPPDPTEQRMVEGCTEETEERSLARMLALAGVKKKPSVAELATRARLRREQMEASLAEKGMASCAIGSWCELMDWVLPCHIRVAQDFGYTIEKPLPAPPPKPQRTQFSGAALTWPSLPRRFPKTAQALPRASG